MGISIVTISGSVRPGNYTGKALTLVIDELRKKPELEVHALDLSAYQLPHPGQQKPDGSAERFRETVRGATGVVLATPEYHGSFSSMMKLAIENLGFPSVLAGKPVVLLGVAAGEIGAIKSLEHLRSVCSHVGAIVLPGLVSVAHVQELFDEEGNCTDARMEKRIRGVATMLVDYIKGAICPRIALESMLREQVGK
jgi:NAD(P)H-dependent FMN reductase